MAIKFLEGKTPAERNKILAAMVLGLLAFVALSYTFLFSGSPAKKTANANGNANNSTVVKGVTPQTSATPGVQTVSQAQNECPFCDLTPLPEDPYAPLYGDAPTRNIFALYDPSQNPPPTPKPSPIATPTPVPSPPVSLAYVNPTFKYSGERDFTLEVGGDKFTADTKIYFNGMEVPTQFGGAQRLTAQIPAALISGAGQRQIIVRSPDGKLYSNVAMFDVQAPPVPNFNYVGLVARKRYNNDMAVLQDKTNKQQFQNVRLGETVGRFKVVSISSREVVMQDAQLSFRHTLPFVDERTASGSSSGSTTTRRPANTYDGFGNVQFQTIDPSQQIPGIPSQYTQQQPQPQSPPQQIPQKKEPVSDDSDDEDN